MFTALNLFKIILLIILGFGYFIGLGWLVFGPVLHGSLIKNQREISLFQEIPLVLIGGLIINFGLVLFFQSLNTSLIIGIILAILGLRCYSIKIVKSCKIKEISTNSYIKVFGTLIINGLILGPILFLPLSEWDARSIWFFHAKMIYASGSFGLETGWLHPTVTFSHTDYPKLIPTIAGQITHIMGFWNEYLPKLSLLFLLVPAIILLFSFYQRSFSFLVLVLLIPLSFSMQLWTGYMDGYLALYMALSMLLLGRFYRNLKPIDLISSMICLILLVYIKNEGELALILGVFGITFTLILKKVKDIRKNIQKQWPILLALIIFLIPFALWSLYKHQWGLSNDLEIGSQNSMIQLVKRIENGSFFYIINEVYFVLKDGLFLLVFLLIASIALRKNIPREIVPIFFIGATYCLGIIFIYMTTPWDVIWHVESSVERTILLVIISTYVASYFLVDNLEKQEVYSLS